MRDIDWERYESVVKEYLAGNLLIVKAWRGAPKLPSSEFDWVSDIAAEFVTEIRTAGYHVVGDLSDLEPRLPSTEPLAEPVDRELLDVALETLADIVRTMPKPASERAAGERIKNMLRGQQLRLRALWSAPSSRKSRSGV